jgi:predicted transcriptional regulator of viral defense system
MRFNDAFRLLSQRKFPVFSFEDLHAFFPAETRAHMKQFLSRWKKRGWIAPLRRGLYELTFPEDRGLPDLYLANRIYSPSYVSLETVLSDHGIIPEVSMAVLSVTSKTTRRFKNRHGLFLYRSVQPKAFCGYRIEKQNGFDVLAAEPEKALVDYLYFKTLRGGTLDFEAERLDLARIRHLDRKKIRRYAAVFGLDLRRLFDAHL